MNAVSFLDFNDAATQGWLQPASLDRESILSRAKMQLEPLLQMLFPHGVNGGVKPGHWAVQNPASTAGTQASAGRA